jgi:hypothetical protein
VCVVLIRWADGAVCLPAAVQYLAGDVLLSLSARQ